MKKRVCDICKLNDADRSFKVKKSDRGIWVKTHNGGFRDNNYWSRYKKIDICKTCAGRLFEATTE
jgi:hypothetical protein